MKVKIDVISIILLRSKESFVLGSGKCQDHGLDKGNDARYNDGSVLMPDNSSTHWSHVDGKVRALHVSDKELKTDQEKGRNSYNFEVFSFIKSRCNVRRRYFCGTRIRGWHSALDSAEWSKERNEGIRRTCCCA